MREQDRSGNNSDSEQQQHVPGQGNAHLTYFQQFKRQLFTAWLPIPTLTKTIILFYLMGLIFIAIGVPMAILAQQIQQATINYDNCAATCTLTLTVPAMQAPIFVYYQLHNFYQNHRLYANSISYQQLQGQSVTASSISQDCSPIINNKDLYVTTAIDGTPLVPTNTAFPCGMVPYTVFNDSFSLAYPSGLNVSMTTDGIVWPSDLNRYKNPSNLSNVWYNITDPRFLNWIRIAPLPNFRKLWARINTDLPAGTYTLTINNNYNVSLFKVEKYFVLATSSVFGSKNTFLYIIYLVMGALCLVVGTVFLVKKLKKKDKKV